jgi:hypothetical protein
MGALFKMLRLRNFSSGSFIMSKGDPYARLDARKLINY